MIWTEVIMFVLKKTTTTTTKKTKQKTHLILLFWVEFQWGAISTFLLGCTWEMLNKAGMDFPIPLPHWSETLPMQFVHMLIWLNSCPRHIHSQGIIFFPLLCGNFVTSGDFYILCTFLCLPHINIPNQVLYIP